MAFLGCMSQRAEYILMSVASYEISHTSMKCVPLFVMPTVSSSSNLKIRLTAGCRFKACTPLEQNLQKAKGKAPGRPHSEKHVSDTSCGCRGRTCAHPGFPEGSLFK